MPQDNLHQCFNGLGGFHLLGCIHKQLDTLDSQQALQSKGFIKQRFQYISRLHGTNIPSEGLEQKQLTAEASICWLQDSGVLMCVITTWLLTCRSAGT